MTPIPNSAMPVVEILRRDVKRPNKQLIPLIIHGKRGTNLRWELDDSYKCPMGLHPRATWGTPLTRKEFGCMAKVKAVKAFAKWWDSLTEADAAGAMEMIWPFEHYDCRETLDKAEGLLDEDGNAK